MTDIIIKIRIDGDQTCAIIGEMPEELSVGFGDTVKDALEKLVESTDNILGICPRCWNEAYRTETAEEKQFECPICGNTWDEPL